MRKESAVDIASLRVMREELARVIGITAQRVSQLSHLGVLPKAVGRKYPLAESVRRYCEQQKERVDDAAHRELTAQRVRLARAKADQAELARLHMLTNAIPLEMAREAFDDVLNVARTRLLSVPARVGSLWGQAMTAAEGAKLVNDLIREALTEASEHKVPIPHVEETVCAWNSKPREARRLAEARLEQLRALASNCPSSRYR